MVDVVVLWLPLAVAVVAAAEELVVVDVVGVVSSVGVVDDCPPLAGDVGAGANAASTALLVVVPLDSPSPLPRAASMKAASFDRLLR